MISSINRAGVLSNSPFLPMSWRSKSSNVNGSESAMKYFYSLMASTSKLGKVAGIDGITILIPTSTKRNGHSRKTRR